jgi:hypothetical protein
MYLFSCEEVINVELQAEEPRLVVNAIFRIDESQEFVPVEVKVTESSNFFEENKVTQLDDNATIFYGRPNPNAPELFEGIIGSSSLAEVEPGSGIYAPDPTFDSDQRIRTSAIEPGYLFQLILQHKGRRYFASTIYTPTVPINSAEQGDTMLFGDDETEIVISFTDVADRKDYYVFDFGFGNFFATDDQFIDGQEFEFSYFYDQLFEPGTELNIEILGATQEFHNYIDLLFEQTQGNGGVFETPTATIRGNVFDVTGLDNTTIVDNVARANDFALGYFAVVQKFDATITVE